MSSVKKSKDFLTELFIIVVFNILFGSLYMILDKKGCFMIVGRFYLITGIIYTFWLCILSITQDGCEKFKINFNYFIEISNFVMTIFFFVKLSIAAKKKDFCSETSVKILSYVFLALVSSLIFIIAVFFLKKFLNSRRNKKYRPIQPI